MTSAYGHPVPEAPRPSALALLADRVGEDLLPIDYRGEPSRPRPAVAAAIHALAAYLAAAAPLPVPHSLNLHAYVPDVAALESVAWALGVNVYGQQRKQLDIPIEIDGIRVMYYVTVAQTEDRPL